MLHIWSAHKFMMPVLYSEGFSLMLLLWELGKVRSCQVEVIAERGSHLYLNYNSNTSLARKLSHSINFLHRRMLTFYCNISDNASIWRLYPGRHLSVQQSALVSWAGSECRSDGDGVLPWSASGEVLHSNLILNCSLGLEITADLHLQASIEDYLASPHWLCYLL